MTKIQPSPYASSLIVSGLSVSAALTSTTLPVTGVYTSEAAFTDSTTATAVPASTRSPTFGSSTYTRSPSRPCAWSLMPMVTLPSPSTRAHSWDFMNFRSPGISFIVGCSVLRLRGGWVAEFYNSNAGLRLAFADEGELHHAHGDL